MESDDLASREEEVCEAVMNWVKEDEVARQAELSWLLPLVRFPMMADAPPLMLAEPLVVAQHPLSLQLMAKTHPLFAKSAQAADCPRLRPRCVPTYL